MSVSRKTGSRSLAFVTALMVVLTLVLPFTGAALAAVTGIAITPSSDTAPATTCNAFTVTLAGETQADRDAETIDVRVTDTDADDNGATAGGANESDIAFCAVNAPAQGQAGDPTGAETGTNPQFGTFAGAGATDTGPDNLGDDNVTNFANGEVCCTDANGTVTFGITSSEAGNFSVLVWYDEPEDDEDPAGDFTATATKQFTAAPQQGNEGVRTLDCEPETDTNPEGSRHSFFCTATDVNGNRVSGATVTFDVIGANSPNADEVGQTACQQTGNTSTANPNNNPTGGTQQTNAQGQVTCTYTDSTGTGNTPQTSSPPGTDTIVAFVQQTAGGTPNADPNEPQDTITKTWVGSANKIECTPDGATAESGGVETVTCTVTDVAGNPVPDVEVDFTETGPGRIITPGAETGIRTNNAGQARVEVQTAQNEEGLQTITGRIDATPTTQAPPTGEPGTACTGTNEGPPNPNPNNTVCSDTASFNWSNQPQNEDPQCSDGVDNDQDGATDFPADNDCDNPADTNEGDVGGRFPSSITIRYDGDARPPAFKGKVVSARRECKQNRTVVLKKVVPGPNRTVGQDSTNRRGVWNIVKRRARGRYYAVVRQQTKTSEGGATLVCGRDRSVTIRIRRR